MKRATDIKNTTSQKRTFEEADFDKFIKLTLLCLLSISDGKPLAPRMISVHPIDSEGKEIKFIKYKE